MRKNDRVVVDTSTLIGAMLFGNSVPRQVLNFVLDKLIFLQSDATWMEFGRVIQRRKFDKNVAKVARLEFFFRFSFEAEYVNVHSKIDECRDPKDDKFLELAVDGNATCIITSDQDLTSLNPFRGIPILTPREFLDTFVQSEAE